MTSQHSTLCFTLQQRGGQFTRQNIRDGQHSKTGRSGIQREQRANLESTGPDEEGDHGQIRNLVRLGH